MFDSRRVFAFSCELDSVGSFDDACTAILSRVKIKHGCVASPTPSFSGVVTHPLLLLAQSTSGEIAFASVCDNGEVPRVLLLPSQSREKGKAPKSSYMLEPKIHRNYLPSRSHPPPRA